MKSRVHPTYKIKYRVANWGSYDRRRGTVTVWLSPDTIVTWEPGAGGTRGGQLKYSDLAVETALTIHLIFHLPLRQTEWFLTSIFGMMRTDLSAPDYTTRSQRAQHLDFTLERRMWRPSSYRRTLLLSRYGTMTVIPRRPSRSRKGSLSYARSAISRGGV